MKRIIVWLVACVALMAGCQGGRTESASAPADSAAADSSAADTLEQIIEETPMPKAADELFDDFFFNFASNRKLQAERIVFPLSTPEGTVEKSAWRTEHFFMRQGYYTLIVGSRRELNMVKDTAVSDVVVERISLQHSTVRQWMFKRIHGLWKMTAIAKQSLRANRDAGFLRFYQRFATDSVFQAESLCDLVQFSGPDPDDDFATMEGVITPDTWQAFAPEMPRTTIYNICYGCAPDAPDAAKPKGGSTRIFLMRGIANGLEMEMTFKRQGGKWKLQKLNT